MQVGVAHLADDTDLGIVDQPAYLVVVILRQSWREAGAADGFASLVETHLADQLIAVVTQLMGGLVFLVILCSKALQAVVLVVGEQVTFAVLDTAELAGGIVGQYPLPTIYLQLAIAVPGQGGDLFAACQRGQSSGIRGRIGE